LDEAKANFDHAYDLDPTLLQAEVGRAFSLGIQQHNSEAVGTLHGLEAKIDEHGVVDPEAMYKIAQAYASIGEKKRSAPCLTPQYSAWIFPLSVFCN
jgi:hypothetical protein